MNELAGKKAAMYGRIGEDYVFKTFKLFRSGNSHDALEVKGNLFGMQTIPIEIKSSQLGGQFIFTNENHLKLQEDKGYYIFVFMDHKTILFCIKVQANELKKIKKVSRFKNALHGRRKNEFFRLPAFFL